MSEEIVLQGGKEEEKGGIHVSGVDQEGVKEGGEGGCRDNKELNWRSMLMF